MRMIGAQPIRSRKDPKQIKLDSKTNMNTRKKTFCIIIFFSFFKINKKQTKILLREFLKNYTYLEKIR